MRGAAGAARSSAVAEEREAGSWAAAPREFAWVAEGRASRNRRVSTPSLMAAPRATLLVRGDGNADVA